MRRRALHAALALTAAALTPAAAPTAVPAAAPTAAPTAVPATAPIEHRIDFAEHAPLAPRSLLLAIARAGSRLVVVGERGHVLLSDDNGRSWTQAKSVPTRALLTGVCFFGPRQGVAVGHDEVILVTADAGQTWSLAYSAPQAQQPLLDVTCSPDGHSIAVGAYGTWFASGDGGASWQQHELSAPGPEGGDFHLNRIAAASATRLYVAGEGGHLYRSDDRGETWQPLKSPYDGSFFGVKPLSADIVLAYGLRGNLFRSEDGGTSWRKLETATHALLDDAVLAPDGAGRAATGQATPGTPGTLRAVVGLSGVVLVSRDNGQSFELHQQEDRKGLAAALAIDTDTLVAVGEGGVRLIRLAPGSAP
ncbi:MAG TPA: YCF48-related protein [Steroidobacteraceae bacterium]|nr:YCF48-related protein [Steroidobacteraceae bacterium]